MLMLINVDNDGCWWGWMLMIVVVDEDVMWNACILTQFVSIYIPFDSYGGGFMMVAADL